MQDKIYYYDHSGTLQLVLNNYPYYSEPGEFKNWTWGYDQQFGKFTSFYRNKAAYPLVIGISGNYLQAHDKLCDIFSRDVIAEEPGYLLLRGWKLKCYITEAAYSYGGGIDRKAEFLVTPIDSTWTREVTTAYDGTGGGGGETDDLGRDYTESADGDIGRGYDYGYNYPTAHSAAIVLPGAGNGYRITIYGPAINPTYSLNGQSITTAVTLTSSQKLVITSNGEEKSIQIVGANGKETDAFVYRDKTNTPFVDLGENTEIAFGAIKLDFTTIERRSEPSWI